ncbi:MAG: hypothetical protein H9855_01350 [Candidatus Acinetobacter avistercoris]|nr:hypothetical protein [Candidatus Acinetobacter avistercoris]
MKKLTAGLIVSSVGIVVLAPILIPLTTFSLYGLEMNKAEKKRNEAQIVATINKDLTDSLGGVDENNNGLRDSIEEFVTHHNNLYGEINTTKKVSNYSMGKALNFRYIRAYQQSMDIRNVPEYRHPSIYNTINLANTCSETIANRHGKSLLDFNHPNNLIQRFHLDESENILGFHALQLLSENNNRIFLNTKLRAKAKKDSDKLIANKYTSKPFSKSATFDDKAKTCMDYGIQAQLMEMAEINPSLIKDELIKSINYHNAKELASRFHDAYLDSIHIQSIPEPKRRGVYQELATAKVCVPILENNLAETANNLNSQMKGQNSNPNLYRDLNNLIPALSATHTVNILIDSADEIYLNTEEKYLAKKASDLYAVNHYDLENLIPTMDNEQTKRFCFSQ